MIRTSCWSCIAACALVGTSAAALAQAYPSKPIRMIVPFAPGGGSDVSGRIIAAKLTESLGQQVVVDNRPGAAGNIGAAITARAVPDGYTVLLADTGFATGISLYANTGYHPVKSFSPISMVATTPIVVVVHPSVPANTVKELVALAKAQPGKITIGSGGVGGSVHLSGEMFQLLTSTRFLHVPYKGAGPAVVDLAAGLVQAMFSTAPAVMPHLKSGRVRPLAIASNSRSSILPDVPTVKETGVAEFIADNWYGVVSAAGTPAAVIAQLHRELVKAVSQADARERLGAAGMEPRSSATPREFGAFIEADVDRWAKVIKSANIKLD